MVTVSTRHSTAVYFWNKASIPSIAVLPSVCATLNYVLDVQLFLWSPCAVHTKHSLSPPWQGRCNTQSTLHPPTYSTTCSEHGTAIPLNDFDLFSMAHLSHLKTCKNFKTISLFPEELWQQQTHKQTNTQTRSSYIRYTLIFVFKGLIYKP